MDSPASALQKAFVQALEASNELKVAMDGEVRAYDNVPDNAVFPYIVIPDSQVLEDIDSCSPDASEVFCDIHIYSRKVGRVEAKKVSWIVRSLILSMNPNLDGWIIKLTDNQQDRSLLDPDGVTSHSVLTFRFLIEPSN